MNHIPVRLMKKNNRFVTVAALLAFSLSTNVLADFVIDADKVDKNKVPLNAVMLYDNGVEHLIERGAGVATTMSGDVSSVPLPAAMPLLIPDGWKAYGMEASTGQDAIVDWRDGESWTDVLERTGSVHELTFEVDWNRKEVFVRPSDEEGAFSQLTMTPSVPIAREEIDAVEAGSGVSGPVENLAPKSKRFTIPLFAGESLRDVNRRIAAQMGYRRGVFDLREDSVDPSYVRLERDVSIQGDNIHELGQSLAAVIMGAVPGLGFHEILDGGATSLLVSNYGYQTWDKLSVVPVQRGSVKSNALRIVEQYGWNTPDVSGWQTDKNFPISVEYSLVCRDLSHCLSRLLRRYPIQSQQIDASKTVVFVQRAQPPLQRLSDI